MVTGVEGVGSCPGRGMKLVVGGLDCGRWYLRVVVGGGMAVNVLGGLIVVVVVKCGQKYILCRRN